MSEKLKVGIVGYGFAGTVHRDAMEAVKPLGVQVDITGIVDPSDSARGN